MTDATGSVDTEDRCTLGRYVKDATRSVDTEDRCTLGRYVKDAMRSVDTEDRCYKKSFVTKQVGIGINYIFRVNKFCVWIFI